VLLAEQQLIEEKLREWGYNQESAPVTKRRGRRPKSAIEPDVIVNAPPPPEEVDEVKRLAGSPVATLGNRT